MTQLETFDVFDTVVTRFVGEPTSLFLIAGDILRLERVIAVSVADFARQRREAELIARRGLTCGRDVTLEEIYGTLAQRLGLTDVQKDRCQQTELELERRLTVGIPIARESVAQARSRHGRVVYISDTYLSSQFIRELLEREGLFHQRDRLYASSECSGSKVSGSLFRIVCQREAISPGEVGHYGDREKSDLRQARRAGLKATLWQPAALSTYETILESFAEQTLGLSSLLAGCSRFARFSISPKSPHEHAITRVAAGVVAPVLIAYVSWLLRRAEQLSLKRLYFVSRDGYILLRIAERLKRRLNSSCELRYLYGSRQAWHLASLSDPAELAEDWVTARAHSRIAIRHILSRLAVTPEELAAPLSVAGITPREYDIPCNAEWIEKLKSALSQSAVAKLVLEKAWRHRKLALRYFGQEGLLADRQWALVDVGWRGRAQHSLSRILAHEGASVPRGLYFGLRANAQREPDILEAYLFDGRLNTGRVPNVAALDAVLEMFCAAPHGMVVAYEQQADRIRPVFREQSNERALRWGLETLQVVVCRVAEHLIDLPLPASSEIDLRPTVGALLETFWNNPSYNESTAWGQHQVESDQATADTIPLARPYSVLDVLWLAARGRVAGRPWDWRSASLRLSSLPIRIAVKAIHRLRS